MATNPNLLLSGYSNPYGAQPNFLQQQFAQTTPVTAQPLPDATPTAPMAAAQPAPDPSAGTVEPNPIVVNAPQSNAMQLASPPAVQNPTTLTPANVPPQDQMTVAQAPSAPNVPAPRQRMSLAEVLGKVGDTMAAFGGKDPLYTNMTRDAQTFPVKLAGEKLDNQAKEADIAQTTQATTAARAQEVHNLAQALDTIGQNAEATGGNRNAAITAAAPGLAKSMGIDAAVGQTLASNPDHVAGLVNYGSKVGMTGTYGKTVQYALDDDGNAHGYVVSPKGEMHTIDGYVGNLTPTKGTRDTRQGDQVSSTDQLTGKTVAGTTKRINPTPWKPGQLDNLEARTAGTRATTAKTLAAIPGVTAKSADAVDKHRMAQSDRFTEFQTSQLSAQQMIGSLNKIITNPDLAHAVGSVGKTEGGIQGSKGANVRAQIDVAAGQAVPLAAAMIKAAGVPRASQMEIMAAANGVEGALKNYNQDADSYKANVQSAVKRLQDRMRVAEAAAVRNGIVAPRASATAPLARGSHAPAVGSSENGYTFLGGDPKNPKSWKAN